MEFALFGVLIITVLSDCIIIAQTAPAELFPAFDALRREVSITSLTAGSMTQIISHAFPAELMATLSAYASQSLDQTAP